MNIKRLKSLLLFLKELPEKKFDYKVFREERSCGTVGCVAGWCAIQNGLEDSRLRVTIQPVEEFLELSRSEAYFLFFFLHDFAKKSDAIKRLEWLVDHGTTAGYPVYRESWDLSENKTEMRVKYANNFYGLELDLGELSDEH